MGLVDVSRRRFDFGLDVVGADHAASKEPAGEPGDDGRAPHVSRPPASRAARRSRRRAVPAATFFRRANRSLIDSSSQKNSGTKKIAISVEASMPPITPVPMARRLLAPGSGGDRERHAAENERERGHDDGAQPQARRFDRRLARATCRGARARSRTRRSGSRSSPPDPTSVTSPTWKYTSFSQTEQPGQHQRAEHRERHRQHHGDRQRPLLELRGEQQEHHDQAEDEGRRRGAARLLLLQRLTGPGEGEVARQGLAARPASIAWSAWPEL